MKTSSELRSVYRHRKNEFSSTLKTIREKINLVSNLRLATAVGMIIVIYFAFSNSVYGYVVAALLMAFLYLVKRHALLFAEKTHLENLVRINDLEDRALSGDLREFPAGAAFIEPTHPYTHDLDIFGEGSMFQYLNRANTLRGQQHLANQLSQPHTTREEIFKYQEAIRDLAPRIDFRQHFQAGGRETNEEPGDFIQLSEWLSHAPILPVKNKTWPLLLNIIPALTIGALAGAFFISYFKLILFPLIILQWIMAGVYLKRVNAFHDYIGRKKNILQKYSQLLHYITKEAFQTPALSAISALAHEAHEKVNRLASLVRALDARTNSLATIFVNSFLLYDLQCVYRLEKWKADNADKLLLWLDAVTEMEALNSYSTFFYNNPSFQFAEITDELSITGTQLAHPLIHEDERVGNDFTIGPNPSVLIITGANMAGKSTFLRTLGVNLVLALNGAPVCASSFRCSIINLRSGMRTADSLKDHQSYFFAELNRLKKIMEELRSEKPLLILLDEILKGTNSNDKQAGSIALVRQLLPHPCLALIATHDLALGELENEYPEKIKNYCFEATIEHDQLSFDYKLKPGLAQKMNASFLMKKMGIIPK